MELLILRNNDRSTDCGPVSDTRSSNYSPLGFVLGSSNPRRSVTKMGLRTITWMEVGLDQIQTCHHDRSYRGASSCLKRSGIGAFGPSILFKNGSQML